MGGDGAESLPMNNTLMTSLPITAKHLYVLTVMREAKVRFGEGADEEMGEEKRVKGERKSPLGLFSV